MTVNIIIYRKIPSSSPGLIATFKQISGGYIRRTFIRGSLFGILRYDSDNDFWLLCVTYNYIEGCVFITCMPSISVL